MRVVVFGAGGILGQHMALYVPSGIDAIFTRRKAVDGALALDMTDQDLLTGFLNLHAPDAMVNLAGEGRTDVVERDPHLYYRINADVPAHLAQWSLVHGTYLVQASSQGVFDGELPPYSRDSLRTPVNTYGWQKKHAEDNVRAFTDAYCIARITFVLGMRPHLREGRPNPFERMLLDAEQRQVSNRWFSVSFARDAARVLWTLALARVPKRIEHIGHPERVSRFELASLLKRVAKLTHTIQPVEHEDFPGIAPRPLDTHWDETALHLNSFQKNLDQAIEDWRRVLHDGLVDEKGGYAGP